jgi:hypothetical protein
MCRTRATIKMGGFPVPGQGGDMAGKKPGFIGLLNRLGRFGQP